MTDGVSSATSDPFVRDMLRDSARDLLARRLPADYVAGEADREPSQLDRALWSEIADMGWLGATVPEADGGSGLGLGEAALLFEEFGRALYPGPYLSNVALALPCLDGDPAARSRLIEGRASFTLAWAEPDGTTYLCDAAGARCSATGTGPQRRLTGVKINVPDGEYADEAVVMAQSGAGIGLYLVALAADGVSIEPGDGFDGTRRLARVAFNDALATELVGSGHSERLLDGVRGRALVAIAYESLGVAERVLADMVAYACAREQFGRAIGAFQALSGPIADRYVEIQLARALAAWSVVALEEQSHDCVVAAEAAKASCTVAAVKTAETATQVFGAIAFTWEHHIHRYLRRALANEGFEGSPAYHRRRLAGQLIDRGEAPATVELMDGADAAAFRASVRSWISESLPTSDRGLELIHDLDRFESVKRQWQRTMAQTGNLVGHWPSELGGRDASPLITAIFRGEAIRAHPRVSHGDGGEDLVAPLLIQYGTEEQKRRFLGPIRNETEVWGQGFSEPDAGSDLAALKTRATKQDGAWILNGNKTWTTYAPDANWLFVLARTDPDAKRHRGITCFIVDAGARGVEIRPIRDIAGTDEFGEVFLTDTEVPEENVLGDVNDGWSVAVMTLAFERVIESCEDIGELEFMFDRLLDGLRERTELEGPDGVGESLRDQVGALWSAMQAVRLVQHSSLRALEASQTPPPESEIIKLAWSETSQRVAKLGLDLFGVRPGAHQPPGVAQFWEASYLNSRSMTIYAGTSEILRSVIAERVLGLPRSR